MCAKTQEGKTLYHRSTTKSEAIQREIYQSLGLNSQILKAKKTVTVHIPHCSQKDQVRN